MCLAAHKWEFVIVQNFNHVNLANAEMRVPITSGIHYFLSLSFFRLIFQQFWAENLWQEQPWRHGAGSAYIMILIISTSNQRQHDSVSEDFPGANLYMIVTFKLQASAWSRMNGADGSTQLPSVDLSPKQRIVSSKTQRHVRTDQKY